MAEVLQRGRSLAETPTYSVASVVTVMVFGCLLVERSIYHFGAWLKKTRRKALFASLEKIKEELMLLGLISLLLAQSARWISEICVSSSLFGSRFYICSEQELSDENEKNIMHERSSSFPDETTFPKGLTSGAFNQCGEVIEMAGVCAASDIWSVGCMDHCLHVKGRKVIRTQNK